MKQSQRQFTIIGLKAGGYHSIEAVELTPDILSKKLVRVIGEHKQGKTSLINFVKIAIGGLDEVQKKEALEKGFYTEINLFGCGLNLYLGVRVTEFQKGENKGEPKIETFIYSKKEDGTTETPILDGKKLTAAEFAKIADTGMTFNFDSVFSEHSTEHKKVIEKMYASELGKLGAAEVIAKVNDARNDRDLKRGKCDGNAAFMEQFESEGWKKTDLEMLVPSDLEKINYEIISVSGKKQSAIDNVEKDNTIRKQEAQAERDKALQVIKDDARKVIEEIRKVTDAKNAAHVKESDCYDKKILFKQNASDNFEAFERLIGIDPILTNIHKSEITSIIKNAYDAYFKLPENKIGTAPVLPLLIQIDEMGIPEIPESYDADYEPLVKKRQDLLNKYSDLKQEPLKFEEVTIPDTSKFDEEIGTLTKRKSKAERENSLFKRFCMWTEWIEAKQKYEACMDELANLYAGVDTGVAGLKIYPMEGSRSMDLWLKYDGCEDVEFFDNAKKEPHFLFEYSAMQQAVLGVMIQASRLDKKDVCLRLCVINELPMTGSGIEMMNRICEKYDVNLITSYPDDRYDKTNLGDGVIVVEGGECFFAGMEEKK